MKFSINFIDKQTENGDGRFQIGELRLGDFYETFWASLCYWNKSQYLHQWDDALKRLCNGNDKSCLITSMFNPSIANFIFWWPLYLDGSIVHVQNQILFFEQLDKPFSELNPYDFIGNRATINDDGNKISEWDVPLDDIKFHLLH
jgi:hypothetical protein